MRRILVGLWRLIIGQVPKDPRLADQAVELQVLVDEEVAAAAATIEAAQVTHSKAQRVRLAANEAAVALRGRNNR